jgi:hypothetical protein
MRKHLHLWLSVEMLDARGGSYEGVIAVVEELPLRNRFTAERQTQPVIIFADGLRLVPNLTMRRTLVTALGHETDGWRGRRVTVSLRDLRRVDRATGEEVRGRRERFIEIRDPHARLPVSRTDNDIDDEAVAEAFAAMKGEAR